MGWSRAWVVVAFVVVAPGAVSAGTVAGTVRGIGGAPLPDRLVGLVGGFGGMSTTTDASGHYAFSGLAAGTYFAKVNILTTFPGGVPDPDGLVGELYADIPCPLNGCTDDHGTEIDVPAAGTVTIDFDLAPGSRIQGTVTAAGGGALAGITVNAYDLKGRYVATTFTDGLGAYTLRGIPAGSYYLQTFSLGARADQLYAGLPCGNNQCNPTTGTAVEVAGGATRTGVDFVLEPAGAISGTITDGGGAPVANATVEVWSGPQRYGYDFQTDAAGAYLVDGLPAGAAYRVLARKAGLVSAIYASPAPAFACPHEGCDIGNSGTPVTVTAGLDTGGRNVQLFPGHSIGGTFVNGGLVQAFGAMGFAGSAGSGTTFSIADLPDGAYTLRATRGRAIAEWYNDRPCPGAFNCVRDSVNVAGADVTGIAFDLDAATSIQGRITDAANGDPLASIRVAALFPANGTWMSEGVSDRLGEYETNTEGLPPGTYKLRTLGPVGRDHADELWQDHPCDPTCLLAAGDPVGVVGTTLTTGIDFALAHTGLRFFTVTPCRVFDSRQSGALLSGQTRPLRVEATCGIPGHARAVSANVTVVSPAGGGYVALWPYNLAVPPATSVLNFNAGRTRANNAILGLSLVGSSNLAVRGAVAGNGSYDVIVDVNGYFAPTVSP